MLELWQSFLVNAVKMGLGTLNKIGVFIIGLTLFIGFFYFLGRRFLPNFTQSLVDIITLAKPYFKSNDLSRFQLTENKSLQFKEKYFAWGIVVFLLLINVFQVELSVAFNEWGRRFYNTIPKKDVVNFWIELTNFGYLAFVHIIIAVTEFYIIQTLILRWRKWMSEDLTKEWFLNHAHHRLNLQGSIDNPDQRIAEDVAKFTSQTTSISITVYTSLLSLYAFVIVLWGLSASFSYKIGDYDLTAIPGYLVWAAVLYAAFGTLFTHLIGRRLIKLDYKKEATEADFRYSLTRIREYGEPIALLKGEQREEKSILAKLNALVNVAYEAIRVRMQMTWFTAFFGQFSSIFPYIMLAPAYFMEGSKLEFGNLQQTSGAFGRVESALQLFINIYERLADYRATINRLTHFRTAVQRAATETGGYSYKEGSNIELRHFEAALPNGRVLVRAENLTFKQHENVLLAGASGSGKSTIFRALAFLWTTGKGEITSPSNIMFLPQKPYIPLGTLREALVYPNIEQSISDEELQQALRLVKLDQLTTQLEVNQPWHLTLSGGEQQRLSLARAFLAKPSWLLLDEATAAMDEPTEAQLYASLKAHLPQTTIISIGHRSTLNAFHDKRIDLVKVNDVSEPKTLV